MMSGCGGNCSKCGAGGGFIRSVDEGTASSSELLLKTYWGTSMLVCGLLISFDKISTS